jgi:trans-2,3-dihydro-3-hydroxyanthranilate isomerase
VNVNYRHVDVFSQSPFGGNSLPVFADAGELSADQMLRITQELRHFEAIFLQSTERQDTVEARIFDLFGELPFAGHPIIGAAAVLHERAGALAPRTWKFQLDGRTVEITTEVTPTGYYGLLDQGAPEFLGSPAGGAHVAKAFQLAPTELADDLPLEVVSTGLRYLIVPVRQGVLGRAQISHDITELVHGVGAEFAVLLDETAVEIRHWNNDGLIEDVATGSAAGAIGAYRLRHGLVDGGTAFVLNQGRFTGRPSRLRVLPEGSAEWVESVKVGGDVSFVGRGVIEATP